MNPAVLSATLIFTVSTCDLYLIYSHCLSTIILCSCIFNLSFPYIILANAHKEHLSILCLSLVITFFLFSLLYPSSFTKETPLITHSFYPFSLLTHSKLLSIQSDPSADDTTVPLPLFTEFRLFNALIVWLLCTLYRHF